ncbi:MAG: RNA polymerase sigma-54 factor [Rhodobacteraceae bacterium]|nr:RNA polymerase sigma-54 factor [Paracoccaceae bacterium]
MELVQTLTQKQTQQMSGQMLTSLAILGMSSHDLSEHLKERANENPFISYTPPRVFAGGEHFDAAAALASDRPSLMAHVVEQIELAFSNPADRLLALRFAEALEPTGWLGQPVSTVAAQAGVSELKAEKMLNLLQGFEPAGLFARSLADCLLIQARDGDVLTWELQALIETLDLLAEGRSKELADICDCDPSDIPDIARQLRGFDPKPGLAFAHDRPPIFPPDLVATRDGAAWKVELNRSTTPAIIVNPDRVATSKTDRDARSYRRTALAEARSLAQALERRGQTLLRTAAVLVERQADFLDHGAGHLVPLSLEDVAEALGLHASTISRASSGRMIQTPTGALPLRAFFCRAITMANGDAISRDAALTFVDRAVRGENPESPLSDDAIVALASRAGLTIARRTVAKYRSTLGIASSYKRRRAAQDRIKRAG